MLRWMRRLSPSMVVALVALFFALGGVAGAASYAIVPLAKRALVADNAKKLGGKTASQVAALPGPASTAAGLVTYATASVAVPANSAGHLQVLCNGTAPIGGGFNVPDTNALDVFIYHEGPMADGTGWEIFLVNAGSAGLTLTGYAVCLA